MLREIKPLTVKQLNTYIKSLIESDVHLVNVTVTGEISNFKNHYQSGHWYFTVKDSDSALRCVMFKNYAARVNFLPENGMQVVLQGRVSVYEKDGQYMLYVSGIAEAGERELARMFMLVKEKLQSEGLFGEENKRPLPKYPKRIAVVTSDTGAAVKDIENILRERYPLCDIVLCPVLVQGLSAADSIIKTLGRVYALKTIDLIIIGRGGGSAEDLAVFNDEKLARKIFDSPVPVISAVGHESDVSISDFVADVRASTPSHAAQIAVPDLSEVKSRISLLGSKITNALTSRYTLEKTKYDKAALRISFEKMYRAVDVKAQYSDALFDKLINAEKLFVEEKNSAFISGAAKLDALSPLKVLTRGYATVKSSDGYIKSAKSLFTGAKISIGFYDGSAECTVNRVESEDNK